MTIGTNYQDYDIVIKNSLNHINGVAGGLSNPNRGQISSNCDKRDQKSIQTGSNYQLHIKESTDVDKQSESYYHNCQIVKPNQYKRDKMSTNPGLNDQEKEKDSIQKRTKYMKEVMRQEML